MFNYKGLLLMVLVFFGSCRQEKQEVLYTVKDSYTVQEQMALGEQLDEIYESENVILSEEEYSAAYDYLSVIYEMAIQTPNVTLRDSLDWRIKIIKDSTKFQIFASPTGHMYLTTGLLRHLDAENQLVSLIVHQMYYLESGACFNLVKNSNDAIEISKIIAGETSDDIEDMARTLLFHEYPKEDIQMADEFQVDLLCPFKYNATGMIDVYAIGKIASSLNKTMPWSNERTTRIALLSQGCGEQDSLFVNRYSMFKKNALPK